MSDGIIATAGSKKNMLVFSLSEYKGNRTFDIRKYYTDKLSGDLKPTRKGIALTASSVEIVQNVLQENDSKIREWLESSDSVIGEVKKTQEEEEALSTSARFQVQNHTVELNKWKSPEFFEVIAEGGSDKLVLNESHSVFKTFLSLLNDLEGDGHCEKGQVAAAKIKKLFEAVLLSFGKSRQLFDDSDEIFDTTVFNWGVFLDRYLADEAGDQK